MQVLDRPFLGFVTQLDVSSPWLVLVCQLPRHVVLLLLSPQGHLHLQGGWQGWHTQTGSSCPDPHGGGANSLDVAVTDADVAVLQGQAALRGHQGSGSVIAGYKRVLSPNDELEANAVLGLRSLLSVTSTRRLGHYTTAALTGSYSMDRGAGACRCAVCSCRGAAPQGHRNPRPQRQLSSFRT